MSLFMMTYYFINLKGTMLKWKVLNSDGVYSYLFYLLIYLCKKKKVLLGFNASVVPYWQCIVLFASLGVINPIIFPYNEHIANIVSLSLSTAHHPDQLTQGLTVLSAHSNNESSVISQCATHTDPSLTLPLL